MLSRILHTTGVVLRRTRRVCETKHLHNRQTHLIPLACDEGPRPSVTIMDPPLNINVVRLCPESTVFMLAPASPSRARSGDTVS
jgi:hypothetical protein